VDILVRRIAIILGAAVTVTAPTVVAHDHDHALAPTEETSYRLSTAATWAVSACAVHCAVTPVAAGLLPLFGIGLFASPWFEWSLVVVAALLGGAGLGLSYEKVHRRPAPLVIFGVGLAMLVATHVLLEGRDVAHAAGAVAGAVVILIAGRINHSLVHACQRCHPHPHAHA
jgi:hypothetical protein